MFDEDECGRNVGSLPADWMAYAAVVAPEVGRGASTQMSAESLVTVVPGWLRLGDVNPFTGTPYARSLFADLPGYAAHVVTGALDLTSWVWDALVGRGRVGDVAAVEASYSVAGWLAWVAQRQSRAARAWECLDCWGTCVAFDPDGSLTGIRGTPVLCSCTHTRVGAWQDQGVVRGTAGRRVVVRAAGLASVCGW